MKAGRITIYVALVVIGSLLTLDAVRRLVTGDYLWWTIEVFVAVVAALLAHRVRVRRPSRDLEPS